MSAKPSPKPEVIRILFSKKWDAEKKTLNSPKVTFSEVTDAIREANRRMGTDLSDKNPANFLKDIIRHAERANANWPAELKHARVTAEQRKGQKLCFEFVFYAPGQEEPFPDRFRSTSETRTHDVQGITISLASRVFGRKDEQWLIQVAVRQEIVPTHLALFSELEVDEIDHLQTSVKLRTTEIDCLFLAKVKIKGKPTDALVTVEAKSAESILPGQIADQVNAALGQAGTQLVVPLALKAEGGDRSHSRIYVCEFEPFEPGTVTEARDLRVASECCYRIRPKIPGI